MFVLLTVTVAAAVLSGGCSKPGDSGTRPSRLNVLLVTLDTTRASRLGCYGNERDTSPVLDALARDGIKFELAIAQAAVTPVSHASILTGLNPYQHGLRVLYAAAGYELPETVPTLATVLSDAGYKTGAILSAFPVSEYFGLDQGFDHFDNGMKGSGEDTLRQDQRGFWRWDVRANQQRSDETTDKAIEWIRRQEGEFFAWVHYWDPHDRLMGPPEEVVARFVSPGPPGYERTIPYCDQYYDSEIFYMDSQFGRLIKMLKDRSLYDKTVIVVVADHGEGLADGVANHGWWAHRLLYQEQIHLPLIIRVPGWPTGSVVKDLVRSIDIFPTVLEVLGLQPPGPVEGVSLCSLMENKPEPPRLAYADALNALDLNTWMVLDRPKDDLLYCAMDRSWKLIYKPTYPDDSELYNLDDDPQELNNMYAATPDQARRLLAELQKVDCFVTEPFGSGPANEEALKRLQALGYLGGDSPQSSPTSQAAAPE